MNKRILIAGGTGLIGTALYKEFIAQGYHVTLLSRKPGNNNIQWNPSNGTIEINEPLLFDTIINLAGESLAGKRWTRKQKNVILDSRVKPAATIEKYIRNRQLVTDTYIGASATGIYGHDRKDVVNEYSSIGPGDEFLVGIVDQWEKAHQRIAALGVRTIILRIGIVLSKQGGALKEVLKTVPFGFVTYFGNGRQLWPWIHIDDLVKTFSFCIKESHANGIYLVVTPAAFTGRELAAAISKQYRPKRLVILVPVFALSIGLGEMHKILLDSCAGYPSRLMEANMHFRFNKLEEAINDLVKSEWFGNAHHKK